MPEPAVSEDSSAALPVSERDPLAGARQRLADRGLRALGRLGADDPAVATGTLVGPCLHDCVTDQCSPA